MDEIKFSPNDINLYGYYRKCEETECPNFIKCPFVRCQEHRTDFAINDYIIPHITPENNIDFLEKRSIIHNDGIRLILGIIQCKKNDTTMISGELRFYARFYFNKIISVSGYRYKTDKTVEELCRI